MMKTLVYEWAEIVEDIEKRYEFFFEDFPKDFDSFQGYLETAFNPSIWDDDGAFNNEYGNNYDPAKFTKFDIK